MDEYEIETECDYSVTLKFPSPDKLALFWTVFEEFLMYRKVQQNKPKCENDRRGLHVKFLHQKTREFIAFTSPEIQIPYREAYKIVAAELKHQNEDLTPRL